MLAELAEQLIRFHLQGPEETIAHIVTTLRLAEAGITARLAAPAVDEQAERRRAADRERVRARRAKIKSESAESADSSPSSSLPPTTPNLITTPSQKQTPAGPLPRDWKPIAASIDLAANLGLDAAALASETTRFARWAAANDARKSDWDAAFDGWLLTGKPRAFKPHSPRSNVVKASFPAVKTVFVKEGTPQWEAWLAAGHRRTMKEYKGGDAGWTFPSEWPPQPQSALGSTG